MMNTRVTADIIEWYFISSNISKMLYFRLVIKRKLTHELFFHSLFHTKSSKSGCVLYLQHISVQTGCDQFLNVWLVAIVVDSITLSLLVFSKEVSARLTPFYR